ncbi:hypothetical protein B0H15DRAFT_931353 [Mycena belliarum]|uniref:Uncharacterized protein n=1 Tax=Mycena belliarum TaxID=1033014 RepID=A0AAD6U3T1_9AGAR|nr:hypothetical protein B0H15DRAFT_931353 [Mycena belliae]
MSSEYGQFLAQLFDHIFFGTDKAAGLAAFQRDVAPDAMMSVNGKEMNPTEFREQLMQFHTTAKAELISKETLAVVEMPSGGAVCSGVIRLKRVSKADGSAKDEVAVAIIKVEVKGGKKVVTAWCGALQR